MRFEIREVTPELAEEWLKNRAPNRKLRGTVVDSYASDMSAGRWRLTHQGIAFDEAGRISDGQHRLAAIIKSGVTLTMSVAHGVESEGQLDMDRHARRTVADSIQLVYGSSIHKTMVAVSNAMRRGAHSSGSRNRRGRPMTAEQTVAWLSKYEDAVRFGSDLIGSAKRRGLGQSSFGAVLARASLSNDKARVTEFFAIALHPERMRDSQEPGAQSAVLLNQYLISSTGISGTGPVRTVYSKAERALKAFLDGVPLAKLYESKEELFPIPEDFEAIQ